MALCDAALTPMKPLLFFIGLIFAVLWIRTLQLGMLWNHSVQRLHQLDSCVSQSLRPLRLLDLRVATVNGTLYGLRAEVVALLPSLPYSSAAIEGLKASARVLQGTQKLAEVEWNALKITGPYACGISRLHTEALPSWPWQEASEDGLGPVPLQRKETNDRIELSQGQLGAAATLTYSGGIRAFDAQWTEPKKNLFHRTSLF